MLNIVGLEKIYGTTKALARAELSVAEGELICLLGPSGCGKSTLLRVISGLTEASGGKLFIDGHDVTTSAANRRPTAMVFQSHALWNHMSVADNVGFGLRVRGLSRSEIARKVAEALDLVGLSGFEKRRPGELSGGQAQRVALARCLVVEPKVLLMDEPFSALDAHLRHKLREELKSLQRRLKLTTIFVTHDQEEAMELADRIVVMSNGVIQQVGAPGDLYLQPQSLTVARFIGTMNEYETTIGAGHLLWFGKPIPTRLADGRVTVLCRPEDLSRDDNGVACHIDRIIDLGPSLKMMATTPQGTHVIWQCPRAGAPALGDTVRLGPARLHIYRDGLLQHEPAAAKSATRRELESA